MKFHSPTARGWPRASGCRRTRRATRCRRSWNISPIASATAPRERDALTHPYFAGHGYACVRVDMRGSGDSEGLLLDEYLKQEQDDALEVIAWIAAQPWCTGKRRHDRHLLGRLQRRCRSRRAGPPPLKAIVTICSTDDRYADDIHYMGGCLLNDNLSWGSTMFAYMSRPPDPALVGERWREMWLRAAGEHAAARSPTGCSISAATPSGSTARSARTTPTSNARSMPWAAGPTATPTPSRACWQDSKAPRKGLIGPWAHNTRTSPSPGPAIGFLQEALRWWDQWLKGIDTGIMDEPRYRGLDGGSGDARPPICRTGPAAGSASPPGHRRTSDRRAWRSIPDGSATMPRPRRR